MLNKLVTVGLVSLSLQLSGAINDSCLSQMEGIYLQDFGKKVNSKQKESMQNAIRHQNQKLRVMTYNMLYNEKSAEALLPEKYQWSVRKPRLLEYLTFAKADIIGSQELQEDQLQEIMTALGNDYSYYGIKTRENEGRTDTNAIFFNPKRLELIDSKTIPYENRQGDNAFTYCRFRDKFLNKNISVVNTKLTWGNTERRLAEASQLSHFANSLPVDESILVIGDFNLFPFLEHKNNLFFDGTYIERVLTENNLEDAKNKSVFGHFGPLCSITNSRKNLAPFIGPELIGFILDHIFVNDRIEILTHGIDTARVNGEFPSDHFPVIADVFLKD
jgi:endonuclease/exonuclease/phosphatase family metal-dependent hydrolase